MDIPTLENNLGYLDWKNDRIERAVKHWIIAAKLGHDGSLQGLRKCQRWTG